MIIGIKIHIGAVTHHQDQSITLVNFRTKKTIKINPGSPMPDVEFELLILLILFLSYTFQSFDNL